MFSINLSVLQRRSLRLFSGTIMVTGVLALPMAASSSITILGGERLSDCHIAGDALPGRPLHNRPLSCRGEG